MVPLIPGGTISNIPLVFTLKRDGDPLAESQHATIVSPFGLQLWGSLKSSVPDDTDPEKPSAARSLPDICIPLGTRLACKGFLLSSVCVRRSSATLYQGPDFSARWPSTSSQTNPPFCRT